MEDPEEEKPIYKFAKPFGKKEKVLNYTSNTYHLTGPKKLVPSWK